jgi:TRAP-type mannitol/chloroaromatic compound transport system substrate-binding protein
MKKALTTIFCIALALCFMTSASFAAAKREKFGSDPRHDVAKRVKFKTSDEKVRWKMVMPWSKGLLFYDIAVHFADSVRLASAGRLDIKPFSAGELVPAMQSFDAVSKGSAQVGHDWPGYWKGKNEAFVAFASVPFGLDAEGYNIWLYEKGGLEMMQELYGKFNLFALPGGQVRPGDGPVLQQTRHQDGRLQGHACPDPGLVHGHHEQPGRLGQPPARR